MYFPQFFTTKSTADSKNQNISGANIVTSSSSKGVVSNEKGEFKIPIEIGKKTTLLISHVEFSKTKKTVFPKNNKSIKINIKMRSKYVEFP